MKQRTRLFVACVLGLVASCGSTRIETVRSYRALKKAGRTDLAAELLCDDPRQWFEEKAGPGTPFTASGGRWKDWDRHFRAASQQAEWREEDRAVSCVSSEWNEYYALIERAAPRRIRLTWYFDADGKICGFLVDGTPFERPSDRAQELLEWARTNRPDELEYLRPGGRIDPTGDRAARTRALANEWREEVGLEPIR